MIVDPSLTMIRTPLQRRTKTVPTPAVGRNAWYLRERLAFIEARLFWYGRINRVHLIERYDLHASAASKDLTTYQDLAPRNAVYNRSAKTYVIGRQFLPIFGEPSLEALHAHTVLHDAVPAPNARFHQVGAPVRAPDPAVARNLLAACDHELAVHIYYRSMRNPEGAWRWIHPRALVTDGHRWHVRAFCEQRGEFRDFVLARIHRTAEPRHSTFAGERDEDWDTILDVAVRPHRKLKSAQQALVADEYDMVDGQASIPCRRALVWYLLVNLGLDEARDPPRQVLELVDSRLPRQIGLPGTATRKRSG